MIRIRGFELVVAFVLSLAAHGGFLVLAGVDQQSEVLEIPDRVVYLDLAAFDENLEALEPIGATVADPLAPRIEATDLDSPPIVAPVEQPPELPLTEAPALDPMAIAALTSHTQDRNLTPPEEPPPPTPSAPTQQPADLVPPAPDSEKRLESEIANAAKSDTLVEIDTQTPSPVEPLLVEAPPSIEVAAKPTEAIPDRLSEPDTTLTPETLSEPESPQPTQPMAESAIAPAPLLDVETQTHRTDQQPEIVRPQQTEVLPPDQVTEPELTAPEVQRKVAKPRIQTPHQAQITQAVVEPPPMAPPISTADPIPHVTPAAAAAVPPTLTAPPTDRPPPPKLSEVETTDPPIAREQTAPITAPQVATAPVTIAAATPPAAVPRGPGVQAVRKARLTYGEALSLRINRLARSSYPRWAIRRAVEGWIPVRIRIGPTGEILDLEVLDDTHAPSRLVETAVEIIRSAAPFQVFSDQMGTGNAVFEVRVNFVLR